MVRMDSDDVENAKGITTYGTRQSQGKEESRGGESTGARKTNGYAEDAQHDPPANSAEEFSGEGDEKPGGQPERMSQAKQARRFGAEGGIAEDPPEKKGRKSYLH